MHIPQPGAPTEIDSDHRIFVVTGNRDGRLRYGMEVRFGHPGGQNWQASGSRQYEAFEDAVVAAHKLRRRVRSERPASRRAMQSFSWPGPEPWSEARHPGGQYDMPTLGGRIRAARARVGMRT